MEHLLDPLLPDPITAPGALGLVALAFLTAALTAAAAAGGGVILLSVLVSFLPPATVLAVHGVVQAGANVGRAALMRRHTRWPLVGWFAAGSLAGAALGAQVFTALPGALLQGLIALFVLWSAWAPRLRPAHVPERAFLGVGLATTFATLFVGATGPLVAAFLSPDRLGRRGLVATHATCMSLQHGLKLAVFGALGFAYLPWAPLLAAMLGSGFLGTLAGRAALNRIPERRFATLFRLVLTALALRLLWGAAAGLLPSG